MNKDNPPQTSSAEVTQRTIKFRAIESRTGTMVYGNFIAGSFEGVPLYQIEHSVAEDYAQWQVKPETVGQFTGLTDSKGVEIYEGDIVECEIPYWGTQRRAVEFRDGGFWTIGWVWSSDKFWPNECSVVGNIYEHPELLAAHRETQNVREGE